MNTQAYIESGILEAYLIGIASDDDVKEVEAMQTTYPEISLALNNLQTDIIQHFNTSAITPPPVLRDELMLKKPQTEVKKWDFTQQGTNAQQENRDSKNNYVEVEFDNTHIKVHKYWRPAFIGVFILSKVFLILALYFYFKSDSLQQENLRLKQELKISTNK
ncbi:hypothetical protein LV89_02302 [Arcicella aurantiaca]|uniref:Uncharacterized protein n=1 Tax=Arcicella aurantiaca TaxID=591202 RepID=A0A316EBU4_9BACT|nr:hypothetical protein [Arcicella aurantiaca]PWK26793.1 hypothetical protein LV89_02302 [Arcicella aurantiaca]